MPGVDLLSSVSAAGLPSLLPAHGEPPAELPPLDVHTAVTTWVLEPWPALMILVAGALYVLGVVKLHRRGDRWNPGRTISFLVGGLGTSVVATQSFLAAYDLTLLSVHMVQHMLLSMLAPVFLALGAPITLALRTLPGGPRAVLMRILHSRIVGVFTFPIVAMTIFVINPWILYFSGIYEATLRNPLLHDANHLHFLLVGCLWYWSLLGIDPLPNRASYPMRMIATVATLPFHAFLGVTIMQSTALLAQDWYLDLGRTWGPSPLEDQQIAGAILWGSGDLMSLVIFTVLAVQWWHASEREARVVDRRLDLQERSAAVRAGTPAEDFDAQPRADSYARARMPGGSRNALP